MIKPFVFPVNRWLEPLFALLIIGGIIRALWFLATVGYLPQPFFYDPYDIWMDWFNTSWWAHDEGMYDSWGSTYPPLSFVFLNIFSNPLCYQGQGPYAFGARDCDWIGLATLHGFYVLNIVLVSRVFFKLDRATSVPRSLAMALGLPMTGALERGNLVIVAFTAVVLAYGPLVRSSRLRWLAAGIAINFKVYLIAALFPQLLRRRWRWFEGAAIMTVIVYLTTLGLLGDGTPAQIVENIVAYTTSGESLSVLDSWFVSTYTSLLSLINSSVIPITSLIGSRATDAALFIIPNAVRVVQVCIITAFVGAWLRPESVSMFRLTNLGICLAIISAESGGYTLIFAMFFTFMEKWRGFGIKFAILICYLMSLPFDLVLDKIPPVIRDTYIGNRTVVTDYSIMLSPFVRPAMMMSIPFALACVTIRDVWLDIQRQGWKGRWRYRRDVPIMVGDGAYPAAGLDRRPA